MDKVVILEHVPNEKAGTLRDYLVRENIPFQEIRLFERGYKLPDLSKVRALIVMGGPMNVYEEDKHPFLKEENTYIQEALKRKIPYLGICLGSQLLAKALGAKVMKGRQPEVGWGAVELTRSAQESGLFKNFLSQSVQVLQWHEDTFDIPADSTLLASNPIISHQAFSYKDFAYGLQFHLEVDRPLLEDWFKNHADREAILKQYETYRPSLAKITDLLYRNFFNG